MFLLEKMTLFVLERFAPRGMGGPRADLLYRNALLSNATNFSNENEQRDSYRPAVLGGTCFYVSAETLSLESPFLKLRKLVPIRMQSSTAREAACASDSENFHELDSENVNAARVNFSMQMCFATYEYNCQRR